MNNWNPPEKAEPGSSWNFGLGELYAKDLNFVFEDPVAGMKLDLLAGEIAVSTKNTDINNKIIDFDRVSFSRTDIVLRMDQTAKPPVKMESSSSGKFDWDIQGNIIRLEDVAFQIGKYSDTSRFTPLSGFSVIGLGMKLTGLQLNKSNVNAGIEGLRFDLGNGFSVKEMNGRITSRTGTHRLTSIFRLQAAALTLEGNTDTDILRSWIKPSAMHDASLYSKGC